MHASYFGLELVQSLAVRIGLLLMVIEAGRSASHRDTSGNFGGTYKYPGSVTVLFCNLNSLAKLYR